MKTIAVIGGSGFTGKQVIKEALKRGYKVKALARNASKILTQPNVEVIEGDATDAIALRQLIDGASAVVSTLGPSGINDSLKLANENAKSLLCYNATKALLPLLEDEGITQYLLMTGAGLIHPQDKNPWFLSFIFKKVAPLFLKDLLNDRHKELALLMDSDIDWTFIRCAKLVSAEQPAAYKAHPQKFQGGKISIQNIAKFYFDQIERPSFKKQAVYLAD